MPRLTGSMEFMAEELNRPMMPAVHALAEAAPRPPRAPGTIAVLFYGYPACASRMRALAENVLDFYVLGG